MPIHAKVSGTPIWQVPGSPVQPSRDSTTAPPSSMPPAPETVPPRRDERGSTWNPIERLRLAALQVSTPAPPPLKHALRRTGRETST